MPDGEHAGFVGQAGVRVKVDLIDIVESESWEACLGRVHADSFASASWLRTSAAIEGGQPVLAVASSERAVCAVPLVLRSVVDGYSDATSPYGYSGMSFSAASSVGDRQAAADALVEGLRSRKLVSCFIRCNPILERPDDVECGTLVKHGHTVSIDLTREQHVRQAQLSSGHRYEIRRTAKAGVIVRNASEPEDWQVFERIYRDTMQRLGAAGYYLWTQSHWSDLASMAQSEEASLLIAEHEGQVLAGAIFLQHRQSGIVHYHLAAARRDIGQLYPGKLIIWEAQQRFGAAGFVCLHLGGGVGARGDSLFAFKAGFSPDRNQFLTRRIILDHDVYARLSGDRPTEFFPAYRAP